MRNTPPQKNPPMSQLEALDALDKALERLRLGYEKYFRGIERRPPVHERMALERDVREFFRSPPRTAVARFRFSNFRQRMTTFETYWNRVMRQIEEGTYERDVRRARSRLAAPTLERSKPKDGAIELDLDLELDFDMDELFKEASESVASLFVKSPEPAKAAPPPPPPAPPAAPAAIPAPQRMLAAKPPAPPAPPVVPAAPAIAQRGSAKPAAARAVPPPPPPMQAGAPPAPPVPPAAALRQSRPINPPPAPIRPAARPAAHPPKAEEG